MNDAKNKLVEALENAVGEIARCEKEADAAIHKNSDQAGFEQWMVEKTEIIVGLPDEVRESADAVGGEVGRYVMDRLEAFSMSAETAFEMNSPFYMSALLYPHSHKPGEPNNLELVLEWVRKEA